MRERYTGAAWGRTMAGAHKHTLGGTVILNAFFT